MLRNLHLVGVETVGGEKIQVGRRQVVALLRHKLVFVVGEPQFAHCVYLVLQPRRKSLGKIVRATVDELVANLAQRKERHNGILHREFVEVVVSDIVDNHSINVLIVDLCIFYAANYGIFYETAKFFGEFFVVFNEKIIIFAKEKLKMCAMNKLFTIILILLPLLAMPQSRESNKLYKKGMELLDAERYEEALPYFQKSDSLDKAKLKPMATNYHRAELMMADCYEGLADQANSEGHYDNALKYQNNVVEIRKKILGEEHIDYGDALGSLAWYLDECGDYTEALRLQAVSTNIIKANLGEQHPDYAKSLDNFAWIYSDNGNFTEAIWLTTIALEIQKKTLGEEHPDYAESLNNLALFNSYIGNYADAISIGSTSVDIFKKIGSDDDIYYADALGNLALYYHYVGDYVRAAKFEKIVLKIREKVLGVEHPYYAISLDNLTVYETYIGNYSEAIEYQLKALEIEKKILGEEHPDYATSLGNLAHCYYFVGNYDEAIRIGTIALNLRKKIVGENHPDYACSLMCLAMCYSAMGNYAEAVRLARIVQEKRKAILSERHPDYAKDLAFLAENTLALGQYDISTDYYKQGYDCINAFVLKSFSSMTSLERSSFWRQFSDFYSKSLPFAAYKHSDTAMAKLAYDGQLFSKGLLLNAELEIQKLVEQSGDTVLANRYYKIKNDRAILDNLYQISFDEREMDADSLQQLIEAEERLLVQTSKAIGDYTKNLSISWKDVQKQLKDGDLAIEFANFKDTALGQQVYIALVIKKGMSAPELVRLFATDDYLDVKAKEYYTTPKLYNLIWKPLTEYLKDAKTVYFSPSGQIHTIGIEYLSDDKGKLFAEQYDTYRLSSTRELALERSINPQKKASTYGGIKYDFSDDDWQNVKDENDSLRQFRDVPLLDSQGRSSGMTYLDGTKIESNAVAALLREADYDVSAMSDVAATEESFKQLSGSGIKILHIGTHGFYMREGDMENAGYKFLASNQQSEEDRALSCNGLLFAGANSALDPRRVKEIPEGADDGIVTAKEISRLDFNGLDLVVLSACQTGLGEITGEGVFGLQRGFKKAGAQTIVMSLWKVADESTQLLMVEFFKNLTAGQSKRAAFLAALEVVRTKYPNPLYWAAFVMVDGN